MSLHPPSTTLYRNATYLMMAAGLWGILYFRLLPLLFAVMLTYVFVTKTNGIILCLRRRLLSRNTLLDRSLSVHNINLLSTTLTIGIVSLILFLLSMGIYHLIHGGNVSVMMNKLAAILADTKSSDNLPEFVLNLLPDNLEEIKQYGIKLIEEYSAALTRISTRSIASFVHILLGIAIGVMLSYHRLRMRRQRRSMPAFKREMVQRIVNFELSFERVFIAQAKISLVDTFLTGLYLYLVLPLFGIELPFRVTVLIIAFIVGLIPVAGNLISNTIIIILSLGISLYVAIASLVFLVVIHKLEYFLNAKIIGSEIESGAWELLVAMIVFERIFGVGGIVVAPVYYAYVKNEMKCQKLI